MISHDFKGAEHRLLAPFIAVWVLFLVPYGLPQIAHFFGKLPPKIAQIMSIFRALLCAERYHICVSCLFLRHKFL